MARHLENTTQLTGRYGISRAHLYKLIGKGLPSVTIGRARRFDPEEVDAWLDRQQAA